MSKELNAKKLVEVATPSHVCLNDGRVINLAPIEAFLQALATTKMPNSNDAEHELLSALLENGAAVWNASGLSACASKRTSSFNKGTTPPENGQWRASNSDSANAGLEIRLDSNPDPQFEFRPIAGGRKLTSYVEHRKKLEARTRLIDMLANDQSSSVLGDSGAARRLGEVFTVGFRGFASMSDEELVMCALDSGVDQQCSSEIEALSLPATAPMVSNYIEQRSMMVEGKSSLAISTKQVEEEAVAPTERDLYIGGVVLDACKRGVEKGRSLDGLNLNAIAFRAVGEYHEMVMADV